MTKHVIALGGCWVLMVGLIAVTFASELSIPLPAAKTDNGITYLSGGIGLDEREALNRLGRDYDLKLGFAEKAGNYLSDVAVVIKDAGGKPVLEAISQGPWFFAQLPTGQYTILATTKGLTRQHLARVTAHGQTSLYFYW